jgi:hypothetical protein
MRALIPAPESYLELFAAADMVRLTDCASLRRCSDG